jgi:hypothetical protein
MKIELSIDEIEVIIDLIESDKCEYGNYDNIDLLNKLIEYTNE